MEEFFNKLIDIYLFVIENAHYVPAIFLLGVFFVLGLAGVVCIVGIIWGVIALCQEHKRAKAERAAMEEAEIDADVKTILHSLKETDK